MSTGAYEINVQRVERVFVLGDWHIPYLLSDKLYQFIRHVDALKRFIGSRRMAIVLNGDIVDFESISTFTKSLSAEQTLPGEVSRARTLLDFFRVHVPDCEIFYIPGNHELRLVRYLADKARALAELDCLQLPELLGLGQLDIQYIPAGVAVFHDALGHLWRIEHGDRVRSLSGATAHAMIASRLSSGASSHTHRLASVWRRTYSHVLQWIECGCLCGNLPYSSTLTEDWQNGYGIIYPHEGTANVIPLMDMDNDVDYEIEYDETVDGGESYHIIVETDGYNIDDGDNGNDKKGGANDKNSR